MIQVVVAIQKSHELLSSGLCVHASMPHKKNSYTSNLLIMIHVVGRGQCCAVH